MFQRLTRLIHYLAESDEASPPRSDPFSIAALRAMSQRELADLPMRGPVWRSGRDCEQR